MIKKYIYILMALIFIIISLVIYFVYKNKDINNKEENITQEDTTYDEYEDALFGNEDSNIEHNLKLTITSPEEETFIPRQARMYNGYIEGNGKYSSNPVKCHWDFYLNENNEEKLYKQMDNTGVLYGEAKDICGFTSTFIESRGKLRVVLTVTIYDAVNENLETISTERSYIVN